MGNRIVVDTSVMIKWLSQVGEEYIETADYLMQGAIEGRYELLAPGLAKYELGNVLLKGKQLTTKQAEVALETLYALPITFISESEDLAKNTFSYASALGITYYDATFIAVADLYGAILLTENKKHQGKTTEIVVQTLSEWE